MVDDGGTDGTSEWLAQQPDIVHVRTDNWGKDWAVNKAFAMARGQYVRFLDSDDWLEPGANDAQLEIALREDADIVVAGYRTVDDRTDSWVEAPWERCDDFMAQQLGECQSSHYSAFLFRKSFIADVPHRQEFIANDDRMFVLEVALKHPKIAIWDDFALVHRHHARGRLQTPRASEIVPVHLAELKIYRKIYRMLADRGEMSDRRGRAASTTPAVAAGAPDRTLRPRRGDPPLRLDPRARSRVQGAGHGLSRDALQFPGLPPCRHPAQDPALLHVAPQRPGHRPRAVGPMPPAPYAAAGGDS